MKILTSELTSRGVEIIFTDIKPIPFTGWNFRVNGLFAPIRTLDFIWLKQCWVFYLGELSSEDMVTLTFNGGIIDDVVDMPIANCLPPTKERI